MSNHAWWLLELLQEYQWGLRARQLILSVAHNNNIYLYAQTSSCWITHCQFWNESLQRCVGVTPEQWYEASDGPHSLDIMAAREQQTSPLHLRETLVHHKLLNLILWLPESRMSVTRGRKWNNVTTRMSVITTITEWSHTNAETNLLWFYVLFQSECFHVRGLQLEHVTSSPFHFSTSWQQTQCIQVVARNAVDTRVDTKRLSYSSVLLLRIWRLRIRFVMPFRVSLWAFNASSSHVVEADERWRSGCCHRLISQFSLRLAAAR